MTKDKTAIENSSPETDKKNSNKPTDSKSGDARLPRMRLLGRVSTATGGLVLIEIEAESQEEKPRRVLLKKKGPEQITEIHLRSGKRLGLVLTEINSEHVQLKVDFGEIPGLTVFVE